MWSPRRVNDPDNRFRRSVFNLLGMILVFDLFLITLEWYWEVVCEVVWVLILISMIGGRLILFGGRPSTEHPADMWTARWVRSRAVHAHEPVIT